MFLKRAKSFLYPVRKEEKVVKELFGDDNTIWVHHWRQRQSQTRFALYQIFVKKIFGLKGDNIFVPNVLFRVSNRKHCFFSFKGSEGFVKEVSPGSEWCCSLGWRLFDFFFDSSNLRKRFHPALSGLPHWAETFWLPSGNEIPTTKETIKNCKCP